MATPPERKDFELACEKWERWQHDHRLGDDQASKMSEHYAPSVHTSSSDNGGERRKENTPPGTVPPAKRLSRALRVFVAWKA